MAGVSTKKDNSASPGHPESATSTAMAARADRDLRVPCFCEENVWRLAYRKLYLKAEPAQSRAKSLNSNDVQPQAGYNSSYYVIFVSNKNKCVCFYHQLANSDPLSPVFWDYHVLLIEQRHTSKNDEIQSTTLVWDMDSHLPYPCPLEYYVEASFRSIADYQEMGSNDRKIYLTQLERVSPCFRVIPAEKFLENFSSDRSHMWDAIKKKWSATPPTYDPIMPDGIKHSNLSIYIDMISRQDDAVYGSVLSQEQFGRRFLQ